MAVSTPAGDTAGGVVGRKVRRAGFLLVVCALFYSFVHAFGVAVFSVDRALVQASSGALAIASASGFVLVALGGSLGRSGAGGGDVDEYGEGDGVSDGDAGSGGSGGGGRLEAEFRPPRERDPSFKRLTALAAVSAWVGAVLFSTFGNTYNGTAWTLAELLYYLALGLSLVLVAILLAEAVGHLNQDIWRVYVLGRHVHESLMGMAYVLVAVPLVVLHAGFADLHVGLFYFLAGAFLIGRDWKDVARGEVLVRDGGDRAGTTGGGGGGD
ncbi:MAG: hypothetical protein ACTSU5_17255 [Promethearchaeota archaeon]